MAGVAAAVAGSRRRRLTSHRSPHIMRDKPPIELPPDARTRGMASIRRYFNEEFELEIGDLKAGLLFDYFVAEHGPTIYNQAIADARAFFDERSADLAAICYQSEFPYWERVQRARDKSSNKR
jgi:uncharacterized protein (DUF2164 family)